MKRKLFSLYIGSFISSILPLAVLVGVRWNDYIRDVPAGAFRLTIGGVMVAIVMILKITHHLKIHSLFFTFAACALFCWLVEAVLADLRLIYSLAAVGQGIDEIFFQTAIKKTRKEIEMQEQAEKIAEAIGKADQA